LVIFAKVYSFRIFKSEERESFLRQIIDIFQNHKTRGNLKDSELFLFKSSSTTISFVFSPFLMLQTLIQFFETVVDAD